MSRREAYERFTCSCGVRCIMIPHAITGNLAPIEVKQGLGGNVQFEYPNGPEKPGVYVITPKQDFRPDEPGYFNHWTRCTAPAFQRQGGQRNDRRRNT